MRIPVVFCCACFWSFSPASAVSGAERSSEGARAPSAAPLEAVSGAVAGPVEGFCFAVTPTLWHAGLFGDLAGSAGGRLKLEDLQLRDTEFSGGLTLGFAPASGGFSWSLSGAHFETSSTGAASGALNVGGLAIAPSEAYGADVSFSTVELTASWPLWSTALPGTEDGRDVLLSVGAHTGVRAYMFKLDTSRALGGASRVDGAWFEPVVGASVRAILWRNTSIDLAGDIGALRLGDASSTSWGVVASVSHALSPSACIRFGYRFLGMTRDAGGSGAGVLDWESSLAGLFVAASLRF